MQPRILLPLAALGLVFAAPAAANAAVTPAINGTTLTLTGDDTSENFTLGVDANGNLTHSFGQVNGLANNTDFNTDPNAATTLPSNGTITVVIDARGGQDNINLSAANILAPAVNGGAGDDVIVGSNLVDAISGGDGNDRITAGRGDETIHGDLGNDVIVWNNGEGDDINIGGGGVDETSIVTGTGDDNMTVSPNGARIRIERGFKVDMEDVDRLSITSFSGNDTLTTQPGIALPMTIDAGSGNDTITTGDGADLINGGDGNDTLNGASGGDRIVGDRGGDTMNGGAGDDTMVWNNGDGSDIMNGDDGVDRVEDNLSAADDTSTLRMENGRVRYDRLNPGPFNLSIATAEVFELNTLGGNDTLTTTPDVTLPLVVDAGAGNDIIQGSSASDSIDGGDGNDAIQLREGVADFVRGGLGADQATVDELDAVAADVESVDRPQVTPAPAPKPGAPKLTLGVNVTRNVAAVKLSCPAGVSECKGTVTLRTAKGRVKTLGKANYTLKAGQSQTLKIKLAKNTAKLAKNKKLTIKARVTSSAGPAKTATLSLRFR